MPWRVVPRCRGEVVLVQDSDNVGEKVKGV